MNVVNNQGFSLIELIVSIAIIFVIIYLSSVSFIRLQRSSLLSDSLWQAVSVLRQMQNRALAGESFVDDHLKFGVIFNEAGYQEFATFSDYANRRTFYDFDYTLPEKVVFTYFDMPDTCVVPNDCVIFQSLTGTASAEGNIRLFNQTDGASKRININTQGRVSY
jgi:prepilin-type N-terminal cleavage/methylation domain-containing protein